MKNTSVRIIEMDGENEQRRTAINVRCGPTLLRVVHLRLLLVLCIASVTMPAMPAHSQASPADGPWSGSIQCQLDVEQPGYSRHETQTWTLTSSTPTGQNGDMRIYPATWTATGQGGLQRAGPRATIAQWNLTAPATSAPIAMFIRAQDQKFIIRQWHSLKSLPNAIVGRSQAMLNGVAAQPSAVSLAASEWQLPWITTDPDTNLSGTMPVQAENLGGSLAQGGPPSTATCTWQFAKGNVGTGAPLKSSSSLLGGTNTPAPVITSAPPSPASGAAAGGAASAQKSGAAGASGSASGSAVANAAGAAGSASMQTLAGTAADSAQTSSSAATGTMATQAPAIHSVGSGTVPNVLDPAASSSPNTLGGKALPTGLPALGSSVDLASDLSLKSTNPPTGTTVSPHLVSGGTASLLFTVSNRGPGAADGAVVSVPAVPGVTIQGVACSLTKCPTASDLETGWKVPQLAAGATETFAIDASVAANSGPLSLMALATPPSGVTDPNPTNNSSTLNATVVPLAADLEVSVIPVPHTGPQPRFAYRVTVKNLTGLSAAGAVVISPAVAGIKKLAISCTASSSARNLLPAFAECPANPTVLQIEQGLAVPRLDAGEATVTFLIDAIAMISGNQTLSASATPASGMSDPVTSNNSATAVIATIGETPGNSDVSVAINPLPSPGRNTLAFKVGVHNAGPDPASLTIIRVPAVAGTTAFLDSCVAGVTATGNLAQCPFNLTITGLATGLEIPWFPANSSLTFTIYLTLPTSSGTVTLSADATLPKGGTDPNLKNNSAHATATIP